VAPEPVWRWQNVGGTTGHNGHNLLDKFYNDKERYAYTFQNYIFFTRMMQAPLVYPSFCSRCIENHSPCGYEVAQAGRGV